MSLDVDIIFYGTTSLHFEIDDEDEGDKQGQVRGSMPAGAKTYAALRKRGHSKNGRGDAPQIVVGLAVTRDGFPVRHWVFPGNTVDVSAVAKVKEDLTGWQLTRCLFVGDAGMVSQANFQALARGGGKYLMAMPMRRGDEVTDAVLSRPGRYRKIAENLEVKEVVVGDGERRRRYAVCFNPQEARRQRAHRDERIRELEAELASLSDCGERGHSKRVCALRTSARYGHLLKDTKRGLAIDRQAIAQLERFDGKFVVHSNDDTLSAEDMALGYKQQQRVEEAWRTMKSGMKMRPVFHWAPHRIHAHIAITVLALLLERVIERDCQDTWRNIRDDLKRIQLAQLSSPNGTVWQVTDPSPAAANRLKSLKLKPPPAILNSTERPFHIDTRPFPARRRKPYAVGDAAARVNWKCQSLGSGHVAHNLALVRHIALNLIRLDTSRKASIKTKRLFAATSDEFRAELLGFAPADEDEDDDE